jgi:hypothetical protein
MQQRGCQQSYQQLERDLARLNSGGCGSKHPPSGEELLSVKDATRRKKVNRTAKLKQCKLDARREQWLSKCSQGVSNWSLCPNPPNLQICRCENCKYYGHCMYVPEDACSVGHQICTLDDMLFN